MTTSRFTAKAMNLELSKGKHIFCSPQLLKKKVHVAAPDKVEKKAERFRAMCFMLHADEARYRDLQEELKQGVYKGHNEYPVTISDAYTLLLQMSKQICLSYRRSTRAQYRRRRRRKQNGYAFAQKNGKGDVDNQSKAVAGKDSVLHDGITCFNCQGVGHYSSQCPEKTGTNLAQVGVILLQQDYGIKKPWILLDTCTTNSVSNNREMVRDIQKCNPHDTLTVHTNGGVKVFGEYATLRIMSIKVHFNEDSLATILALKDVASIPRTKVTTDTSFE